MCYVVSVSGALSIAILLQKAPSGAFFIAYKKMKPPAREAPLRLFQVCVLVFRAFLFYHRPFANRCGYLIIITTL